MKNERSQPFSREFIVVLLCAVALLGWMGFPAPGSLQKHRERRRMAEAVSNSRQIWISLSSFAMDNNGLYPDEETAVKYGCPADGSSNALFRQLFAGGHVSSETVFWLRDSSICAKVRPDDVTSHRGGFDPSATLQPGDNGWAYVMDQESTDHPERPLLVTPPPSGEGLEFDPEFWRGKVVVLRIEGAAKPERLDPEHRLLDQDNAELLTTESAVWGVDAEEVRIAYPLKATKRQAL